MKEQDRKKLKSRIAELLDSSPVHGITPKFFNYLVGQCINENKNLNIKSLRNFVSEEVGYIIPAKEKKEALPPTERHGVHGFSDSEKAILYYEPIGGERISFYFWDAVDDNLGGTLPESLIAYLKQQVIRRP